MSDPVNHPSHYHSEYWHSKCGKTIECIDIVRHMDFDIGSVVKYCWRAGKKDDEVQDLEKAIWYLQDRVSELKRLRQAAEEAARQEEDRSELIEKLAGPSATFPPPLTVADPDDEPRIKVTEGITFDILTAKTANFNWMAFNTQPFYLQLPDRQYVREELLNTILKLPPTEFDKLAAHVREAVVDWQWATGTRGDC